MLKDNRNYPHTYILLRCAVQHDKLRDQFYKAFPLFICKQTCSVSTIDSTNIESS